VFSELNSPPVLSPVNASPRPRGSSRHDSGPMRLARPSLQDSSILYSPPILIGAFGLSLLALLLLVHRSPPSLANNVRQAPPGDHAPLPEGHRHTTAGAGPTGQFRTASVVPQGAREYLIRVPCFASMTGSITKPLWPSDFVLSRNSQREPSSFPRGAGGQSPPINRSQNPHRAPVLNHQLP